MLASNLLCITIAFVSDMKLKTMYLHREERKPKSKSILNPSSWHWSRNNSETCHKLEATRCFNSQRISKRWFGEQASFARKVKHEHFYITKESVMDGYSSIPLCRAQWEPRTSPIRDYNQFWTIMSRSNQWLKLKYSNLRNFDDWSTSTVTTRRNFDVLGAYITKNRTTRTTIFLTETDTASSQQSISCGRLRAQGTGGQSPVSYKPEPKPKPISIGFSQRVWKSISAKAPTKIFGEFVSISKNFTKIPRHTGCHESDGAVRSDHVLKSMQRAEQTQSWDTEKWMPLVVLLTNPDWSIVRVKTERLFTFVPYKDTVIVSQSIQLCFLWKRYHWVGKNTYSMWWALPTLNQSWGVAFWAGGWSSRSTRQACFFSRLTPQDSSRRQRTIDWTGPVHDPRMVLYKQSNRQGRDCDYYLNLRRAHVANALFRLCCSDPVILYDNMWASALDKTATFASEVLVERKPPTLTKPEATPGEENWLAHIWPNWRVISSLMKQVLKSPNTSAMINDLINNFSLSDAEQVDYYLVPYTDSENRTPQNGILERHEVFIDRRLCSMSHMLHMSKTRRDILFLRKHSTRHYRRRSRRRQSNESTVDSSCTSLDVTILR